MHLRELLKLLDGEAGAWHDRPIPNLGNPGSSERDSG